MGEKLYARRDVMSPALRDYYTRHVAAMTEEDLHHKGDIAAELAWRDARIAELQALMDDVIEPRVPRFGSGPNATGLRELIEQAEHRALTSHHVGMSKEEFVWWEAWAKRTLLALDRLEGK